MKLPDRDAAHLLDMLLAARELQEMLGEQDLAVFLENRILVRAVERMSEIIGEAARRVSDPCKQAHPQIRWRQIIGQRNILAHEYGRIEYELLYRTAVQDVPLLIRQLESLLPPMDGS
jgi:uncharacterized protein with HEPN domain